jgi:hypothetical protein
LSGPWSCSGRQRRNRLAWNPKRTSGLGSGLTADVWVVEHTVRTLKSDESQQTGLLPPTDSQSKFEGRERCRDSLAGTGFRTTYKNAGTAKIPVRRTRLQELWVGLWVGQSRIATKRAEPPALSRNGDFLTIFYQTGGQAGHQTVIRSQCNGITPLQCCAIAALRRHSGITSRQ